MYILRFAESVGGREVTSCTVQGQGVDETHRH